MNKDDPHQKKQGGAESKHFATALGGGLFQYQQSFEFHGSVCFRLCRYPKCNNKVDTSGAKKGLPSYRPPTG